MDNISSTIDTGIRLENKSLAIQNRRANSTDIFNSVNSCDEVQRKKAIDRVYCYNQFTWYMLSSSFYMFILPILIIIIILLLSRYYENLNYMDKIPYFILWTIIGIFYSSYQSGYGWNKMKRNMLLKDNLDINNCLKDVNSY